MHTYLHRNDFKNYDKLLNYMLDILISRDGDLRANKSLTQTVFLLHVLGL